jgi:hypothetical protein
MVSHGSWGRGSRGLGGIVRILSGARAHEAGRESASRPFTDLNEIASAELCLGVVPEKRGENHVITRYPSRKFAPSNP